MNTANLQGLSRGQDRPRQQPTLFITPCLQHSDFCPPGICTSTLSNFRCPSSQLPGFVGSGIDPNRRGLTSFGQSPGLLHFSCTSPALLQTLMSPRSPFFYQGMSSPALSPSTTCNARAKLPLLLSFDQDITWLSQVSCCVSF